MTIVGSNHFDSGASPSKFLRQITDKYAGKVATVARK
jgi:hypothetical protein